MKDAIGFFNPVWGGLPRIVDPALFWDVLGSVAFEIGQLWATFCTQEAVQADRVNTGFLGHNWTQICTNSKNYGGYMSMSIWVATS